MLHMYTTRCKPIVLLMMAAMLLLASQSAFAQHYDDDGHGSGRNWELVIGVGGGAITAYDGSDEYELMLMPFVDAAYHLGMVSAFVNGEKGVGMGVNVEQFSGVPLTVSASINLGEGREPGDASILKGTPEVNNTFRVIGSADLDIPFGEVSAKVNYLPTKLDYNDRKDTDYDGLFAEFDWEGGLPLSQNMMMQVGLGIGWMNSDYADSFYSVHASTQKLKTYNANSGLHDVHASTQMMYMFTSNFGAAAIAELTYLLGDAADSPITENEFQPFGGALLFYNF